MANKIDRWLKKLGITIDDTPLDFAPSFGDPTEEDEEEEPDVPRDPQPIYYDLGAERLIDAVLALMARDYIHSLRRLLRAPEDKINLYNVKQTEAFIRSDTFVRLTMGTTEPEEMIESLRAAAAGECNPGSIHYGVNKKLNPHAARRKTSGELEKEKRHYYYERRKEKLREQGAKEVGGEGLKRGGEPSESEC